MRFLNQECLITHKPHKEAHFLAFSLYPAVYYEIMKRLKTDSAKAKPQACSCKGLFWIEGPEELFLGKGRVMLLEKIREHGSLAKAAKSMGITYRHATEFVDSMNRQAVKPLVAISDDGRFGRAKITAEGRMAIRLYRKYTEQFDKFLQRIEKNIVLLRL
jgi:molybdate transport system regulatory protein